MPELRSARHAPLPSHPRPRTAHNEDGFPRSTTFDHMGPKYLLLLLTLLSLALPSRAQIQLYRTYADLLAETPMELEGYELKSIKSKRKQT